MDISTPAHLVAVTGAGWFTGFVVGSALTGLVVAAWYTLRASPPPPGDADGSAGGGRSDIDTFYPDDDEYP